MKVYTTENYQQVTLEFLLVDGAGTPAVFMLRVEGEPDFFFEADPTDALDIVEQAFEARKRMKEEG